MMNFLFIIFINIYLNNQTEIEISNNGVKIMYRLPKSTNNLLKEVNKFSKEFISNELIEFRNKKDSGVGLFAKHYIKKHTILLSLPRETFLIDMPNNFTTEYLKDNKDYRHIYYILLLLATKKEIDCTGMTNSIFENYVNDLDR
jgi:hypothetical protein